MNFENRKSNGDRNLISECPWIGKEGLQKGLRELPGLVEISHILPKAMVTWVFTFVKSHGAVL